LNAIRHENATKQKTLEEYQTRYDQMIKDADEAVKTDAGESETAVVCFISLKNTCLKKAVTPFQFLNLVHKVSFKSNRL
jgi:hypothetical protein